MKINTHDIKKKNILIITSAILVVVAILVGLLIYKSQTNKEPTNSSTNSTNQPTGSSTPSTTQTKPNADGSQPETVTPAVQPSVTPVQPSGTFVSNHYPNISGSPAPNVLSSTCVTTPGAQCKISFTKGGSTVSLTTQTTDSDGNTSWEWSVKDLGLGAGEWSVTAIAINGDKTASSTDSMKLTVRE